MLVVIEDEQDARHRGGFAEMYLGGLELFDGFAERIAGVSRSSQVPLGLGRRCRGKRSSKVVPSMLAGSISSLNVAVTAPSTATSAAPAAGVVDVTVGGSSFSCTVDDQGAVRCVEGAGSRE